MTSSINMKGFNVAEWGSVRASNYSWLSGKDAHQNVVPFTLYITLIHFSKALLSNLFFFHLKLSDIFADFQIFPRLNTFFTRTMSDVRPVFRLMVLPYYLFGGLCTFGTAFILGNMDGLINLSSIKISSTAIIIFIFQNFDIKPFYDMISVLDLIWNLSKYLHCLHINIQIVDNNLLFDIYYEPTNSLDYLTYTSCHSPYTKYNMSLSLAKRIVRVASNNKKNNWR